MIDKDKPLSVGHLDFRMEVEVPYELVGEYGKFAIRKFLDEEFLNDAPLELVRLILKDTFDELTKKMVDGIVETISAKRNGSQ